MSKIFREPLLHFLLIGLALFLVFDAMNKDTETTNANEILITAVAVQRMATSFETAWKRPPTSAELTGLIDDFILEEVLVREALALGLDQNDVIIRQRLRAKMAFLTTAAAEALQPGDAELQAHYDANKTMFSIRAQLEFSQVFLGPDATPEAIANARALLTAGKNPQNLGQSNLLPTVLPLSSEAAIDAVLGTGVFAQIWALNDGAWAGPVQGDDGLYLVRVTKRIQAQLPPLADIRDNIRSDWRNMTAERLASKQAEMLTLRYQIRRPSGQDLAGILQ